MSVIKQLKIKGITSGVVAFILLYAFYSYLVTWSVNNDSYNQSLTDYGGYIVWFLSGYVAGIFSKTAGIINGAVAGLITPLIIITYLVIVFGGWQNIQETVVNNILFWIFFGFFLCGVGGLAWDIQKKIT